MTTRQAARAAALSGFLILAGCVDLEVQNPGEPDRDRALTSVNDLEQLVAGQYRNVYNVTTASTGPGPALATMSMQHAATAANFGMVDFSYPGSSRIHHEALDAHYGQFANAWTWLYRAVASVAEGLREMDAQNLQLPTTGSEGNRDARVRAYGYFVLGLAHGTAALLYDQGYIYDPTMTEADIRLAPYTEVMDAAYGYLDRAIQEATGNTFTIPEQWMARQTTSAQLVQLAYSYKARFRAAVARTPQERASVDWQQVIADVDRGVTTTFSWNQRNGTGWTNAVATNVFRLGSWGQMPYHIYGMADQSGNYQEWLSRDPWQRHPNLSPDRSDDPFMVITPDVRFPRGSTLEEQILTANRGRIFEILNRGGGYAGQWSNSHRGPFRWSYYRVHQFDQWLLASQRHDWPEMRVEEMRLLRAEALYRTGNPGGAALIVNETRVPAGLNATDAEGTNTSCVPRLPSGECGDLFEMLKWEVRLETMYTGLLGAPWYFHGRGWGDLPEGTPLQLPVPGQEAFLLGIPSYTFGGIGNAGGAPVSNYGF